MADEVPVSVPSEGDLFRAALEQPPQSTEPAPPAPEPVPEVPAAPEPSPAPAPVDPTIPPWRLREEAERARAAEDKARALEARLQEIQTHLQQSQKAPDFFENPDQATQRLIMQTVGPYAEAMRRDMMHLSRMVAGAVHGATKVDEAEAAFMDAREKQTLDPADYERVVGAPNRYDAVVQWHKRQSVLSSVGDDPAAWFEKQLEARMADPAFQAKLLEKVRTDAAGKPSVVKIPPSLSKATAAAPAGGAQDGDMSDASLFAFATKR